MMESFQHSIWSTMDYLHCEHKVYYMYHNEEYSPAAEYEDTTNIMSILTPAFNL